MTLPPDWPALRDAARAAGWEIGHQSRYGATPRVYAWRCERIGGAWTATGEAMEIGTVEMARGWIGVGCEAPITPIELWAMRRAA